MIGFIGGIRPNKGLEDLIAAFQSASTTETLLLIAGRPWPPESYVDEVFQLAKADHRIRVWAKEISDEEMQVYLNAADVLAFPFRQVLTSSSVILAMSFGRPVIVPRLGCLPELVGADAGFIYEPGDVAGLTAAIRQAAAVNLGIMGASAAQQACASSWRDLALQTIAVYIRRSVG